MMEWWESLGVAGKVYAAVAIPSTVVLFLQTLLLLLGLGHGASSDSDADVSVDGTSDADADFDGNDGVFDHGDTDTDDAGEANEVGGLHWLTMRGCIAFLTVFGWVGILCVRLALPGGVCVALAFLSGALAMFLIALLFRFVYALQSDGTENIKHAIGVSGTVYLRIPPDRTGSGKVNLLLDGRLVEKEAITDDEMLIANGQQVLVVGIAGGNTLIVRKK